MPMVAMKEEERIWVHLRRGGEAEGHPERLRTTSYQTIHHGAPKVTVAADPDTSEGKPVQGPSAHAAKQVTLSTPIGDMWPRPYIIDDDLRRVAPYHFTYNTWCKERWRNRPLIEIFESEFRDRPLAYYKRAMESGSIYVNGHPVGPDYIVRNGDKISHTLHRHEPPVTAEPIGIIHEDDDMIVINKPAGVPVHPAGRYNFNSVIEIMKSERGPAFTPHPCNRLDRLTSGIMFIGKTPKRAEALGVQIKSRTVRKEYLARVTGMFPDGEVVCDQPILSISPKLGLNRVRANGKSARTVFKRLAYYPPRDGAQQPAAEPSAAEEEKRGGMPWKSKQGTWGTRSRTTPSTPTSGCGGFDLGENDADGTGTSDEDVITRLSKMGKEEVAQAVVYYDEMVDDYEKRRAEKMTGELCEICDTPLYSDPGSHELSLWLHSLRYEDAGGEWAYISPLPKWALPPKGMSGPTTVGGMDEMVQVVKDENPEIAPAS
uniref:Pseudouridine synthase n=1 Tax=Bionectria ochroleuca TaxID=29856 RepID=A0A8H7NCC8_BIOOC